MHENWERFEAVLRGEIPDRVPLTHTWGLHRPHCEKLLGGLPSDEVDELEYRSRIGLSLGLRVGRGSPYGSASDVASDGTEHYVPGQLSPGTSLKEYEDEEDLSEFARLARHRVRTTHAAGLGAEGCVMSCIHAVSTAMGLERLAFAAYEKPDWLEQAMELVERRNRRSIAAMIDAGVDIVLFDGDCAYKQGLMMSPEMMRRFWFGRTKESVRLLHDAGVWAYYHTDGNVNELLGMLIELGFAAFHGCEKAANDLGHLKRTFGEEITLIGNADQAELTMFSAERVVAETEEMIRTGAPAGRFVADVNTSVREFIPVENYEAFVETVRRVGVYAADGSLSTV